MDSASADLPDEIKDSGKRKLISKLLDGEPEEDSRYIFVIEHMKTTNSYGFVKFEVFNAKKTVVRFKIQQHISKETGVAPAPQLKQQNQFDWNSISVGKRELTVGLVDVESKSIFEKIKEGVELSLEEGRLPFLKI